MKNLVKKIIFGTGLVSLLSAGLSGCGYSGRETSKQQITPEKQINSYENNFNSFETIKLTYHVGGNPNIIIVDMDGDGDMDIIAAYDGQIFLFENKIPQKNKK